MGKRYLTSVISCLISTSRSIIPGLLVLMLAASPAKAQGPGTALQYDGVDDYTVLPANILSSVTGSFTLEAWVYWTGANNFYPRVFDFGSSQNNWVAMAAANPFANGNAPIFAIQVGGLKEEIIGTTQIPTNQWTHMAVTLDNATGAVKMYINGVLDVSGTFSFRLDDIGPHTNNWIARSEYEAPCCGSDTYFQGSIDELRISNNIRYTANFTPSHNQFNTDVNTVALYHFNEGSGQVTADASGNFGNGILGGTVAVEATDPTWITNSILPIKLTDFTVNVGNNQQSVEIKWTASLDRASEFSIERSSNGSQFNSIGTVSLNTGTLGFETFSFRDLQPMSGRSYYRLKGIETGMAPVYSRVVPVNIGKKQGLVVYPNPVTGTDIHFELDRPFSGKVEIALVNSVGARVFVQKTDVVQQREFKINKPSGLQAGNYLLEVTVNGTKETKQVLVQ